MFIGDVFRVDVVLSVNVRAVVSVLVADGDPEAAGTLLVLPVCEAVTVSAREEAVAEVAFAVVFFVAVADTVVLVSDEVVRAVAAVPEVTISVTMAGSVI